MYATMSKWIRNCVFKRRELWLPFVIWAEESGSLNATRSGGPSWEFSFGNGATSGIGIKIPEGKQYRLTGLSYQANIHAAQASCILGLYDIRAGQTATTAVLLAQIDIASATDGGGQTNNASKWRSLPNIAIPSGAVLAFATLVKSGNISNVRVAAFMESSHSTIPTF